MKNTLCFGLFLLSFAIQFSLVTMVHVSFTAAGCESLNTKGSSQFKESPDLLGTYLRSLNLQIHLHSWVLETKFRNRLV